MRRLSSAALILVAACTRGSSTDGAGAAGSATNATTPLAASANGPVTEKKAENVAIDFEKGFDGCTLSHRGVLLDLADRTMHARSSGAKLAAPDIELKEHDGAMWADVHARSLEMSFVATSEMRDQENGIVVEARMRGAGAKSASVYLNGKPLGTLALEKGVTKIVSTHLPTGSVLRGANELLVHFLAGPRQGHDSLAEIDWIRVGPNDGDAPYAAPTRSDALTTATLGGVPRRALSLRAPGSARCTGFVPNGAMLEGFVGASGGEGEAEVRVIVDRNEPRVIGTFHVGGPNDPPGWRPITLPLGDVGTIAAVELVAKSSSKGARIAFAQARVVAPDPPPAVDSGTTPAKGVILVVLGTLSRKQISPYGGPIATPELAKLAETGALFEAHRGTSSSANGAVASMLSGALARDHGVDDEDATFAPNAFTIAEAARQAGVVTAMFTANPTTSAAYGFARGFDTFVPRFPSDDAPATGVFDDVIAWLDKHKDDRFFVVVHARGGHPPWDVTSEDVKELPPAGYTGSLEPKRAGEGLAKAKKAGSRTLVDADRERAFALHAKAVAAHDAALGKLAAELRTIGRENDTAWIVTSDVGVDAAAHVPFLEGESLDEDVLSLPLVVVRPGPKLEHRVTVATSSVDIARTVLDALALAPPAQLRGEPLWSLARAGTRPAERPLTAETATRFSMRWGSFALVGAHDREIKLCNLSLDPDCVSDVRASHPIAAELMHGIAFDEIVVAKPKPKTPRVSPDAPLAGALRAWGR